MGQVSALGTQIERKKTNIKGGEERQQGGGGFGTPTTQRILEKAHRIVPRTNLPR